jgi:hypothetical protein
MPALLFDPRPIEECIHVGRLSWSDIRDLAPNANVRSRLIREWLTSRAAIVYSSRFIILSRLLPTWLPIASRTDYLWADLDRWGAGRLPDAVALPERRAAGWAQARAEYAERLAHFEVSPGPAGYLRRLLGECRQRNIPAMLLLMPEDHAFRALYPSESLRRLNAFVAELTGEFRVPVIDARGWLPDSAFYDGHHLLPAGAWELSRRLNDIADFALLPLEPHW